MEVMTPVFLCALVALLPQALGKSPEKIAAFTDLVKNKYEEKQLHEKNAFTTVNVTSNFNKVSDLQSVFMNPACKQCHRCMELTIKAHKVHSRVYTEMKTNDFTNEIDNLDENITHRSKRNLGIDQEVNPVKKSTKKSKTKKSKNNKSVSVTKYSNEGKVYALKVKETLTPKTLDPQNQTKGPSKCQVYKVTEAFSCDSPDADLILAEKRKINKTSVNVENPIKNKENKNYRSTFKKRHVIEVPQESENFMPSIEESY